MNKKIKLITFDLDDTLWDNHPTIIKAEVDTRKWIEEQVGEVEWGDLNDFLELREDLIKEDKSIAWDISKLRKEIFRIKLSHVNPTELRDEIVNKAFEIFLTLDDCRFSTTPLVVRLNFCAYLFTTLMP